MCHDFYKQLIDGIKKRYGLSFTNVIGTPITFKKEMYHSLSKFLQHIFRGDDLLICLDVFFNSVPKAHEEVRGEAINSRAAIYVQIGA